RIGSFLCRHDAGAAEPRRQPSAVELMSQTTTAGTRESLVKVLGAPSFAYRADEADRFGLQTQRSGDGLLRFAVAGKERPSITIGGSEPFGLPAEVPQIRRVDGGLRWFRPAATPQHRLHPLPRPVHTRPVVRRAAAPGAPR